MPKLEITPWWCWRLVSAAYAERQLCIGAILLVPVYWLIGWDLKSLFVPWLALLLVEAALLRYRIVIDRDGVALVVQARLSVKAPVRSPLARWEEVAGWEVRKWLGRPAVLVHAARRDVIIVPAGDQVIAGREVWEVVGVLERWCVFR